MSIYKPVFDATKKMLDTQTVKNDISEALFNLNQFFQEKYFNSLQSAITTTSTKMREEPPREVSLLQALKPFVMPEFQSKIDKISNSYLMLNMISNVQNDSTIASLSNSNAVIHDDGIYEIDKSCKQYKRNILDKQGIAMLMALIYAN